MRRRLLFFSIGLTFLTGCAGLTTGRNFLSDDSSDSYFFNPQNDFPVMAGDSGKFGLSEGEMRSSRSEDDRTTYALEKELVELEDAQTESNLELYNQHRHKFLTTSEKIYFLNLPTGERSSYLVSKGMIKPQRHHYSQNVREAAIRHSDILMGMSKHDVMNSWGSPARVEVAGNPSYENERWAYQVNGATKYIYFESGKVEGWE